MEPNQIKDADILDILFEGRNKDYGAYELRKTYNRRIKKAMIGTGMMIGLLLLGWTLSGMKKDKTIATPFSDVDLLNVVKDPDKPLPQLPQPKAPKPIATTIFTPPKILKDQDVPPDEKPPIQADLDQVKIGTANIKGGADDGTDAPAAQGVADGIVTAPKKQDPDDGIFTSVEIESSFPGGSAAWLRFLNKNLHYSDEAINSGIEGTVVVQFIVDKEGNVSDVEVLSGPEQGGLREEVLRVIKKSGKWVPAQQNGRYVKSYHRQPVIFQVPKD